VSVVMPVRNEERYVERAVGSILEQTLRDLELIAVDDGSTDGTTAILTRLAARDGRIVVLRRDGEGLVDALNAGVARSRATYVARMDADDISLPQRLERQLAELDARPRLGVLGTRIRYIDTEERDVGIWEVPVGHRLVRWTLAFGTPLAHPSVVMRRELLTRAPYSTAAPHAEDYDLWVRLAAVSELDNVPEVLVERRVHGDSVSDRNTELQQRSGRQIQQRAIASGLGVEPSDTEVRALVEPHSWRELGGAVWLIWRLYRASGGGSDIRRDAIRRVVGGVRNVLRAR
jgi:glycosyltransferase involved in cell wall biosynthesis